MTVADDRKQDAEIAVLANRMAAVEAVQTRMDSKLDTLLADKQRRDGAIAAGNWLSRAFWAVIGAFGMWYSEHIR